MAKHIIKVDYNHRDPSGRYLRRKLPVSLYLAVGDGAIVYEPSDRSEADATVVFVGDEWSRRRRNGPWMHRTVYLKVIPGSERTIHDCDAFCDADCDAYCHEEHEVPWKRRPGHPYPRIVNGVQEGSYPQEKEETMPRGQKDQDGAKKREGADQDAGRAETREKNAADGNPEGVPKGDKGHDPNAGDGA